MSMKLLVILVTFSLITNIVSGAVDTSENHGSPDLSRRSPESGVDETMQDSNSFQSSPDDASDSGNSDTDYDQDLDFQTGSTGSTGDLPQPDRQDGNSGNIGSNSNDAMSKMEEEIEKLSDEMRKLESQVSQNGGSGSSRKVNQLEDELRQVKSELQTVADQIQGKTSELSEAESQLENQLVREMKRIEEELSRIEAMIESNTGQDKIEETFQTNNDANDYNLDNDFVSGQSRISGEDNNDNSNNNNNNNNNNNINNNDVNNPETSSYDYVYSADVDFLSNVEGMYADITAVEAQQIQFIRNQFQAKVIGIIFGSVLGLVIVVGLIFGCFINVLLYIKRQSGSKDESASLTT